MTTITDAEIKKITHLARLEFKQAELDTFTKDLSNILDLINQIHTVDTTNIEPMSYPQNYEQRLRPDETIEINDSNLFTKIAPELHADFYIVPSVK